MEKITVSLTTMEWFRIRSAVEAKRWAASSRANSMFSTKCAKMKWGEWSDEQDAEWSLWYEREEEEKQKWEDILLLLNVAKETAHPSKGKNPFV